MKVLPGASPNTSLTNKNVRYMEVGGGLAEGAGLVCPVLSLELKSVCLQNSKMLPPSKRFKMENSVPVHQNGIEATRTGRRTGADLDRDPDPDQDPDLDLDQTQTQTQTQDPDSDLDLDLDQTRTQT